MFDGGEVIVSPKNGGWSWVALVDGKKVGSGFTFASEADAYERGESCAREHRYDNLVDDGICPFCGSDKWNGQMCPDCGNEKESSMKKKLGSIAVEVYPFNLNGETAYEGSLCDGEYWFEIYRDGYGWECRVVREAPRDDEWVFGSGSNPNEALQDAVDGMRAMGVNVTASSKTASTFELARQLFVSLIRMDYPYTEYAIQNDGYTVEMLNARSDEDAIGKFLERYPKAFVYDEPKDISNKWASKTADALDDEVEVPIDGEFCEGYVYISFNEPENNLECNVVIDCWGDNGEDYIDEYFFVDADYQPQNIALELISEAEFEYGDDLGIDDYELGMEISRVLPDVLGKSAKKAGAEGVDWWKGCDGNPIYIGDTVVDDSDYWWVAGDYEWTFKGVDPSGNVLLELDGELYDDEYSVSDISKCIHVASKGVFMRGDVMARKRKAKKAVRSEFTPERIEYLKDLAFEYDVPEDVVFALADILGPNEDYDGLVTELEDYGYGYFASKRADFWNPSEMEQKLMDIDNDVWDAHGWSSGNQVRENWDAYKSDIEKALADSGVVRSDITRDVIDGLEDNNFHSLIKALGEIGAVAASNRSPRKTAELYDSEWWYDGHWFNSDYGENDAEYIYQITAPYGADFGGESADGVCELAVYEESDETGGYPEMIYSGDFNSIGEAKAKAFELSERIDMGEDIRYASCKKSTMFDYSVVTEINPSWSGYDKSVAQGQLDTYGEIYVDSYGQPIDNEYDLMDIEQERGVFASRKSASHFDWHEVPGGYGLYEFENGDYIFMMQKPENVGDMYVLDVEKVYGGDTVVDSLEFYDQEGLEEFIESELASGYYARRKKAFSGLDMTVYDAIDEWLMGEKDFAVEEMDRSVTCRELIERMNAGEDVYDILDAGDSMVREYAFDALSEITGLDYDVFYYAWLHGDKIPVTASKSADFNSGAHGKCEKYITNFHLEAPVNDYWAAYKYLTEDDMTQYLLRDSDIPQETRDAVLSIEWVLEDETSGLVELYTTREMEQSELDSISMWVRGQNSDGLGEGFEQQDFAEYRDEQYEFDLRYWEDREPDARDFEDEEDYDAAVEEWEYEAPNEDDYYIMCSFDWSSNRYEFRRSAAKTASNIGEWYEEYDGSKWRFSDCGVLGRLQSSVVDSYGVVSWCVYAVDPDLEIDGGFCETVEEGMSLCDNVVSAVAEIGDDFGYDAAFASRKTSAWDWSRDDGYSGCFTHRDGGLAFVISEPGDGFYDDGYGIQVFDETDDDAMAYGELYDEAGPFASMEEAKSVAENMGGDIGREFV